MKSIAVLLTVHNRKTKTLQCLQNLHAQQKVDGYEWDVYLTDDGCTDGTPEAIKELFPLVNIEQGDGNLYWNRGMYKAWEAAVKAKNYDYYLWLNDDSFIFKDTISHLLECDAETNEPSIICGSLCSANNSEQTTYGGHSAKGLLSPNGTLQELFLINGNVVLIPSGVYKKVGMLDFEFPHAIGDFDYGLRARNQGISSFSTKKYVGTCENNSKLPKWCYSSTPIKERFHSLYSPLGTAHPKYFFIYENRHFGLLLALKHWFSIHLRMIIPSLWK